MKRIYLILLFLWPALSKGAQGDITGVSVDPNGRDLIVYISALNTNGTYNFNLETNRQIRLGAEAVKLTVIRPAFTSTGGVTTEPETVWGMAAVAMVYPNQTFKDEIFDAATQILRVRIVMNRFIYTNDTLTASFRSALYTENGTNSNAATDLAVTNNTLASYQKVVGNWTMPAWNKITNSTMTLSAVGFHQSGRNRRPIKFMQFIVSDEHSHVTTNTATDWQVQWSLGERLKTGELVATIDTTGFTDHDQLRCDFVMYPWYGDTNCVLDTRNNVYTGITSLPASVTNLLDIALTYAPGIAVVDSGGSDSNGRITNLTDPTAVNSAHYFLTIAGAGNAMSGYNNTNGSPTHSDMGGGIIYVKSTIVDWTGATVSSNNTAKCVVIVAPYTGSTVVLTNDTGSNFLGQRAKVQDIELAFTSSITVVGSMEYIVFDRCRFNSTGTAPFQPRILWATHGSISNLTQGIRAFSTGNTSWMVRDNDLTGFNGVIRPFVTIGNYHPSTNGANYTMSSDTAGQTSPGPDWQILYNNDFRGQLVPNSTGFTVASTNLQYGAVWAQNIFENATNAPSGILGIGTGTSATITNMMFLNNVVVGNRTFTFYNDVGTNALYRRFSMMAGNIFEVNGFKSDTFAPGDSNRVGNFDIMYQVNCRGNLYQEMEGGPAPAGAFPPHFTGLNSYHPNVGLSHATNVWGFAKFISQNTVQLTNQIASGGGNYRYQSSSPVWNFIPSADFLPIDMDGYGRGGFDPPGVFTSGCAKKGAFFGGQ